MDGLTVVTPRAWEDLSEILQYHEELGLAVSEELTTQYLQNKQVARDFAIYYELYQKYRQAYNIDAILQGVWDEDVLTQARSAKMDERMSLVSLLLEAVFLQMERCTLRHDALRLIAATLKAQRGTLDVPGDALTALAGLEDNWRAEANKAPSARPNGTENFPALPPLPPSRPAISARSPTCRLRSLKRRRSLAICSVFYRKPLVRERS